MHHSDFLAYLQNPNQNHELGDAFVKRFLQEAIMQFFIFKLSLFLQSSLLVLRYGAHFDF